MLKKSTNNLELSTKDRILVLAPHPDDEALGMGGVLQAAARMKVPTKVVFVTHGDSNQWSFLLYRKFPVLIPSAVRKMGLVRRDEAVVSCEILGIKKEDLAFLGYPDFGLMNIWLNHWNTRKPLRSILTRTTQVPYEEAFRPGALYKGEELQKDLSSIVRSFKPTKIFVPHPEDQNSDHCALYLLMRVVIWDQGLEGKVSLHSYLTHYPAWPRSIGVRLDKPLAPPETLLEGSTWKQFILTPKEVETKRTAVQAHRTQYRSSARFLLSFVRSNELFCTFPSGQRIFSLKPKSERGLRAEWKIGPVQEKNLMISVSLSRPMLDNMDATIHLFGYNNSKTFKEMPKITLRLKGRRYFVFDQKRQMTNAVVSVKRSHSEAVLSVPMRILGDPDRILVSVKAMSGKVVLNSATWVALEI